MRDAELTAEAELFRAHLVTLANSMTMEAFSDLFAKLCNIVEFIAHEGQPEDWTEDYPMTSDFARAFSDIILGFFGYDRELARQEVSEALYGDKGQAKD